MRGIIMIPAIALVALAASASADTCAEAEQCINDIIEKYGYFDKLSNPCNALFDVMECFNIYDEGCHKDFEEQYRYRIQAYRMFEDHNCGEE